MSKNLVRLPIKVEELDIDREVIIAESLIDLNCYMVRSIPAFIYGLALGDTIKMVNRRSGSFVLLSRGNQVTIRVFVDGGVNRPDVRSLIDAVSKIKGLHEVARNDTGIDGASLLLISVDIEIGFSKIESLLRMVEGQDVRWEYGNIYDINGDPLNWWLH